MVHPLVSTSMFASCGDTGSQFSTLNHQGCGFLHSSVVRLRVAENQLSRYYAVLFPTFCAVLYTL